MNRLNAFVIAFAILLVGTMATSQKMTVGGSAIQSGAASFLSTITADGDARFRADTYIGTANTDSLTVLAKVLYGDHFRVRGNTHLGNTATDSVVLHGVIDIFESAAQLTVRSAAYFNGTAQFNGIAYINGATTNLGNTVTDVITVIGKFALPATPSASPVARQMFVSADTLYVRNEANNDWLCIKMADATP